MYKYQATNQSIQVLLSDTLGTDKNTRCLYNIDVSTDMKTVFTGLTIASFSCIAPFDSSCDSEFRIYAIDTSGVFLWAHDVGGDAMHFLKHVVATPDNGVLALYYRYDEFAPETKGDIYWIKFNQDGSQDLDYLNGFTPASTGIENGFCTEVNMYPNPASDYVLFEFAPLFEASILRLYDLQGRIVREQEVAAGQSQILLDVSKQQSGCYLWSLSNLNSFSRLADGRLLVE